MVHQSDPRRVKGLRDVRGASVLGTGYRFPRSKIPTAQVLGADAGNISSVPGGASDRPDTPASGGNVISSIPSYPEYTHPYIKRNMAFTAYQRKRVPGRILTFKERFSGTGQKE